MNIRKLKLEDFAGNYPQKPGRKKHPLKVKYKGMQVAKLPIGHVNPKNGKVEYNELVGHPTIKRIMRRSEDGRENRVC